MTTTESVSNTKIEVTKKTKQKQIWNRELVWQKEKKRMKISFYENDWNGESMTHLTLEELWKIDLVSNSENKSEIRMCGIITNTDLSLQTF